MIKLYRLTLLMLMVWYGLSGISQVVSPAVADHRLIDSAFVSMDSIFAAESDDRSPVVITDINITGYRKTRLYIIEREIPFKLGDYISKKDLPARLELCRQQLMNTSLFVDVDVKLARQYNELAFIDITVKERWYMFPLPYFKIVDRNFNQWWVEHNHSLKRVNYGIKFMHNNFSGRNDELNVYLINGYTQQASFRYTQPFADKSLKYGFDVGFAYARTKELGYATIDNKQKFYNDDKFINESMHTDFAISYRPRIKTRHYFRFSYTQQKVTDSVYIKNPDYFDPQKNKISFPEISYSINYYNVDYIPYPFKGTTFNGTVAKRGFTPDMNMWHLSASATQTIPIFPKAQLYLQATGTIKLPFDQPYYNKRLFGYGDLYMRGLEYYVADGVAGFVARATIRKEILSFNIKPPIVIEGHDKIPFRILLKTFGDVGYAYDKNPVNSNLNNKLLKTWGVGIDILTFYDFVIRFEYSFNQLNEQGIFIHTRSDF
jgi:outer membrane protein assembly factor BamA